MISINFCQNHATLHIQKKTTEIQSQRMVLTLLNSGSSVRIYSDLFFVDFTDIAHSAIQKPFHVRATHLVVVTVPVTMHTII